MSPPSCPLVPCRRRRRRRRRPFPPCRAHQAADVGGRLPASQRATETAETGEGGRRSFFTSCRFKCLASGGSWGGGGSHDAYWGQEASSHLFRGEEAPLSWGAFLALGICSAWAFPRFRGRKETVWEEEEEEDHASYFTPTFGGKQEQKERERRGKRRSGFSVLSLPFSLRSPSLPPFLLRRNKVTQPFSTTVKLEVSARTKGNDNDLVMGPGAKMLLLKIISLCA